VVTIDDILDYLLPDDWRSRDDEDDDRLLKRPAVGDETGSIPIANGRRSGNGPR
jgi:hypothetical protein